MDLAVLADNCDGAVQARPLAPGGSAGEAWLSRWRSELSVPARLALALSFACLTALSARVVIPLYFTPVPITGQVFAVLLSGVLLGRTYGGLSQVMYVGLGSAGLPWFAAGGAGLPIGPSGGYLIGFIAAAVVVGWLTERRIGIRPIGEQVLVLSAGAGVILLLGAIQFAMVMRTGLVGTIMLAVAPFIVGDFVKVLAVAVITSAPLPAGKPGTSRQRPDARPVGERA